MPFDDEDRAPRMSPTSGAEPYASPYYNRAFWAAYKGLSRGMFGGIILGSALGLGIGVVLAGGVLAFGAATVGSLAGTAYVGGALAVAAASTAIGAKYGKDAFSTVGAVAGSNSTVMEINDQKTRLSDMKLDKALELMDRAGMTRPGELETLRKDIALLETQQDQYFEKKFTTRPFFFGKVAAVGAVAGLLLGAVLCAGGGLIVGPAALSGLPSQLAIGLTLAGSALAGASYGINRDLFRRVFDVTNPLYDGDLSPLDRQRAIRARGVDPVVTLTPRLQPVSPHAAAAVSPLADEPAADTSAEPIRFAHRMRLGAAPGRVDFLGRLEAAAAAAPLEATR